MGLVQFLWGRSNSNAYETAEWNGKTIQVQVIAPQSLKRGSYNNVIADEGYMTLQTRYVADYKIDDEVRFRGKRYVITDVTRDTSEVVPQASMYMGGYLQEVTLQLFEVDAQTRHYKVATPQIKVVDGKIEITCDTIGAVIYFTTDGTRPSGISNVYKAPFTTTADEIRTLATKEGYAISEVAVWNATKMF